MWFPEIKSLRDGNEGTAIILLAWHELFSEETPDSYQPKLLNIPSLVDELGQIAIRAKKSPRWERHVKKIQEELKCACEIEQEFLKQLPKYHGMLESLVSKTDCSQIEIIAKVARAAQTDYEELANKYFYDSSEGLPKTKSATLNAIQRLATIAVRRGRTIEDFNHLFKAENLNKPPKDICKMIISASIPKMQKYLCKVAVRGQKGDLEVIGRKAGFGIVAIGAHVEAFQTFSENAKNGACLSITVEASKPKEAAQEAFRKIRSAIDIYNFYSQGKSHLLDDVLVTDENSIITLVNLQHDFPWQSRPRKNAKKLAKNFFNTESGERFHGRILNALEHYSLAQINAATRVRLVNLWSALECLTTGDDLESIITGVCACVVPLVAWRRSSKILSYCAKNILSLKELSTQKLGPGFPETEEGLSNERLILALTKPEGHPDIENLQIFAKDHPLLGNRIFSIWKTFSEPINLAREIQLSANRTQWHLYRIYRARNLIIHEGEEIPHLPYLLGNLHHYFSVTFSRILHGMQMNHSWSVMDSIEYWRMQYEYVIKSLERGKQIPLEVGDFLPMAKSSIKKAKLWP